MVDFETYIEDAIGDTVAFLPKLVGALIILLIGWVAGIMLGKYLSKGLDRVGVDDAIRKTSIGQNIEKSGLSLVRLFDLLIRWFVYLIALMGATNVLEIEFLSTLGPSVSYIPNVAAFTCTHGWLCPRRSLAICTQVGSATGNSAYGPIRNVAADILLLCASSCGANPAQDIPEFTTPRVPVRGAFLGSVRQLPHHWVRSAGPVQGDGEPSSLRLRSGFFTILFFPFLRFP